MYRRVTLETFSVYVEGRIQCLPSGNNKIEKSLVFAY